MACATSRILGRGWRRCAACFGPGGRAGVLDFNRQKAGGVGEAFQRAYLRRLVVPTAALVGLKDHYAYLEASLQRFPDGAAQERLALDAGFRAARHRALAGGQMGLLLLEA